ncbi:MAG: c-type cytochrome [Bdellovibrionaceae bacterium]|nr:c-type cytochrome [Bdellovibrio sp.]
MKRSTQNLLIALAAGSLAFSTLTGCTDHSRPNVELIQDMMESPAIKPQEYDENSPNHSGMRLPPEGTQPYGFTPYKYAKDIDGATGNKNPLAGDYSEDTLKVGIKFYVTNCAVCHGEQGQGGEKLSVGSKMALKPPSLWSPKVRAWTDGQIYHVITMGQGLMGPYASHIPQQYRWQVVNYVRTLQKENK